MLGLRENKNNNECIIVSIGATGDQWIVRFLVDEDGKTQYEKTSYDNPKESAKNASMNWITSLSESKLEKFRETLEELIKKYERMTKKGSSISEIRDEVTSDASALTRNIHGK